MTVRDCMKLIGQVAKFSADDDPFDEGGSLGAEVITNTKAEDWSSSCSMVWCATEGENEWLESEDDIPGYMQILICITNAGDAQAVGDTGYEGWTNARKRAYDGPYSGDNLGIYALAKAVADATGYWIETRAINPHPEPLYETFPSAEPLQPWALAWWRVDMHSSTPKPSHTGRPLPYWIPATPVHQVQPLIPLVPDASPVYPWTPVQPPQPLPAWRRDLDRIVDDVRSWLHHLLGAVDVDGSAAAAAAAHADIVRALDRLWDGWPDPPPDDPEAQIIAWLRDAAAQIGPAWTPSSPPR